jgi:DnaK suppressor protein
MEPRSGRQPDRDRRAHVDALRPYAGQMEEARARALLSAERERIEKMLATLERGHGDPEQGEDPANLASDLYQEEFDEGRAEDLRRELASVERAEERLANGTYGLSIESGEPIPDQRLEALPTAERTAEEEDRRA